MGEKLALLAERGWTCQREGCGAQAQDLDEAILTRGDMRGFSWEQRRLAFCSINLELVCARHNREEAQDREGAWARACERYGEEKMRAWYRSMGLRAPRREWL
jgi:hypothetical protein